MKRYKNETLDEFGARLLISRLAEHKGYTYNPVSGLVSKHSNVLVANDPNSVAKILLGQMTTKDDLLTVESIINVISRLTDYSRIIDPVVQPLLSEGIKLPPANAIVSNKTGTVEWFRQLMDKCNTL